MIQVHEISLLMDFYGQLLTARQYEIMDLHYNNDYSLGEISEQLGISRQGVYDNIKRAKAQLIELEDKLGLVSKFSEQKNIAQEILGYLRKINADSLNINDRHNINKVEEGIVNIINKI